VTDFERDIQMDEAFYWLTGSRSAGKSNTLWLDRKTISVSGHQGYEAEYLTWPEKTYDPAIRDSSYDSKPKHGLSIYLRVQDDLYELRAEIENHHWTEIEQSVRAILSSFDSGRAPVAPLPYELVCDDPGRVVIDSVTGSVTGTTEPDSWMDIVWKGTVENTCNQGVFLSIMAVALDEGGTVVATKQFEAEYLWPKQFGMIYTWGYFEAAPVRWLDLVPLLENE